MGSWCTRSPAFVIRVGLRVLEFLASTIDFKLSLIPIRSDKRVVVYSDASFSPHGAHSISGILVTYLGRAVAWKAKKQSLISLSTAESELIAGCEAVVLAQSTEAMIIDLNDELGAKLLLVDNLAAISLAEGSGSQRTRHLRVRSNFVKELVDQGDPEVEHCPGEYQLADILTKVLPGPRHLTLSWLIGLGPEPATAQVATLNHESSVSCCHDSHTAKIKLVLLLLMLQMMESEATSDEEEKQEPLSLELSLLAVMMMLSVLFVWETSKYCLTRCCRNEPRINVISADDDEARARRQRRQEAVRRAIDHETDDGGLRRRRGAGEGPDDTRPVHVPNPVIQVNVGEPRASRPDERPPPIPRFISSPLEPTGYSASSSDPRASWTSPITPTTLPTRVFDGPNDVSASAQGLGSALTRREIAVQTDFLRGLTHEEMCNLQVVTSSSRTPGAVHLFPECHALRGVTSTSRRTFCRYCVNAAARSGI